jgi:hypothetical protein
MRPITIKRARTWHYRKTRPYIERSNDLAPLSPFRSWLDCTTNTSGSDFRKGQLFRSQGMNHPLARMRMIDGFNEGWIDFEGSGAEHRTGRISLEAVLKDLAAQV